MVPISSILVKKNPNFTAIVRRISDTLRDLCEKNGFNFIRNDVMTSVYLWKGVLLQNMSTHILSNIFFNFLNNLLDSNFNNRF